MTSYLVNVNLLVWLGVESDKRGRRRVGQRKEAWRRREGRRKRKEWELSPPISVRYAGASVLLWH